MLYGLRKFLIMATIVAIAIIFRVTDLISGSEMVSLLNICAPSFFASNLFSKVVNKIENKKEEK